MRGRSLAMPPRAAGRSWHYRLITVSRDEDHHDLTTRSPLRHRHEFEVEHRGKVERARVEAIEPSGIGGVDARVTARIIEEAIGVNYWDAEIDVEIRA